MAKSIGLATGLIIFLILVYLKSSVHFSLATGIATFVVVSGMLETLAKRS